jgi:predicted RNA-binding Zn-ribbon protein involved in translation (DUF1610 family)
MKYVIAPLFVGVAGTITATLMINGLRVKEGQNDGPPVAPALAPAPSVHVDVHLDKDRPPEAKALPEPVGVVGKPTREGTDSARCPVCGGEMVVRHNRTTGEAFLSCKEFPECRGTRPLPKAAGTPKAGWDDRARAGTSPACPKCGKPMVKRTRKADGEPFWGCSDFPNCRATRPWDRD